MRRLQQSDIFAVTACLACQLLAQTPPKDALAASGNSAANAWSFSLLADGYAVPHAEFFVSPTVMTDHGWFHLEGRYNYENQKTGSAWFGVNLSAGKRLEFRLTPMLGGVFGNTTGIAPGLEISLTYRRIALTSAQEYVIDTKDRSGSFFYSWPQLTYSPRDWIHFGVVAQRTKAYQTRLNVQRGVLGGFSFRQFTFTTYMFNAGWTEPTFVFEAGYSH